jgi:hypothetical protein
VRFSVDCLGKMRNVVLSLVDSLAANLSMRVGLHSVRISSTCVKWGKRDANYIGETHLPRGVHSLVAHLYILYSTAVPLQGVSFEDKSRGISSLEIQ